MPKLSCILIVVVSWTLLTSCQHPLTKKTAYFDSLVTNQVTQLSRTKATLTKWSSFDGQEEKKKSTPTAPAWEDELGVFKQLSSFEMPAYRSIYHVDDGLTDPSSNLIVRRYRSIGDVPVPELRFYYFQNIQHLKKIEAVYRQHNVLYSTTRYMRLEFEDVGGKPLLSAYEIAGTQKMILSDSVKFTIRSEIIL